LLFASKALLTTKFLLVKGGKLAYPLPNSTRWYCWALEKGTAMVMAELPPAFIVHLLQRAKLDLFRGWSMQCILIYSSPFEVCGQVLTKGPTTEKNLTSVASKDITLIGLFCKLPA
jgi:hypothetical protein